MNSITMAAMKGSSSGSVSSNGNGNATPAQGGQWQQGANLLDTLLSPTHACHSALSDTEKQGMREIRRLLVSRAIEEDYIPKELSDGRLRCDNDDDGVKAYLALEFGGIKRSTDFRTTALNVRHALGFLKTSMKCANTGAMFRRYSGLVDNDAKLHLPREWFELSVEKQREVCRLLDYEGLKKWGYNGIDLDRACDHQPLLFLGWAIVGAPYAQKAMVKHLGLEEEYKRKDSARLEKELEEPEGDDNVKYSYDFVEEFGIPPETLCNFFRAVEATYIRKNPYHNNMHGADVLQTTFALMKMGGEKYVDGMLDLYGLLVAAACHDMHHPGVNNSYQINAHTDLAVNYNNRSVLENMHSAAAIGLLKKASKESATGHDKMNILEGFRPDQANKFRNILIESILATDMSNHFSAMASIKSKIAAAATVGEGTKPDPAELKKRFADDNQSVSHALRFFVHAADISNAAKPAPMFSYWADCVLSEFFAQGDREASEGLTVSPMCDRNATELCDSQIGFIKYIVRPMFELLAVMIPEAQGETLTVMEDNLRYWEERKKEGVAPSLEKKVEELKVERDEPQSKEALC